MIARERIDAALRQVLDPEMPINIVDLGLVQEVRLDESEPGVCRVLVRLLPTFVGCPALDMIRGDVVSRVGAVAGVASVEVRFENDPPWSVERISQAGREALRAFGVSVPAAGACHAPAGRDTPAPTLVPLTASAAAVGCPFCGASATRLESRFGPTRCKMIYYCDACRNTFEQLKPV